MLNKNLTLLGFASKAGKLAFGMDAAANSLKSHRAHIIITACDISPKSFKEIAFFSQKYNIPIISFSDCNMERLSKAVGRKCGIISVNDEGFSKALLENFEKSI